MVMLGMAEANVACSDSACSSCTSGYLFNSVSCLPMCPTGYTQSQSNCLATDHLNIFTLNLFDFTLFSEVNIGQFYTPGNIPFSTPTGKTPIPTANMGFYFTPSSSLACEGTGWILSPDFTISFLFFSLADGKIFQVDDGRTFVIGLGMTNGNIELSVLLADSQNQASTNSMYYSPSTSGWVSVSMIASQGNEVFTVTALGSTQSLPGFEFRHQSNFLRYSIGDAISTSAGFTGFLYILSIDNQSIQGFSALSPIYMEAFQQYSDVSFIPQYCTGSACSETWPWCIRASCNHCYSDSCATCDGYGLGDCTSCVNSQYSPPECGVLGINCLSGGLFDCLSCTAIFVLIDGLCLIAPFQYNAETLEIPVVDVQFDTFEQFYGGVFSSGADSSTYSPWNMGSDVDPIAVKSRGLYFISTYYLTVSYGIVLNYKFTIALWVLATTDGQVYANGSLILYSNSCASLYLFDYSDAKWVSSGQCVSGNAEWIFIQLSVGFSSSAASITISINQAVSSYVSFSGYAFYDYWSSYPKIGNGFVGFIYRFTIWQTDHVATDSQYDVCGGGLAASCLWTCNYGYFYNDNLQACIGCDASCSQLCSTFGTCAPCAESSCSTCTNFNATCIEDLPSGQCIGGLTLTQSGSCCAGNCGDCYGPSSTNCLSCVAGYYLLGDNCVQSCPQGFVVNLGNCVASVNPYISLSFDVIQAEIVDSASGIVFTLGDTTNFYPGTSVSNPIPTMQRGYYFTSSYYLVSTVLTVSYNFTIILYIRPQATGGIFYGAGFSLSYIGGGITLYFIDANNAYTMRSIVITNTDAWIVLGVSTWHGYDQLTTTQLQYSGTPFPAVTSSYSQPASSVITALSIGSVITSFTGFLWSFDLYSSIVDVTSLFIQTCLTSTGIDCLWSCAFDYYLEGSVCVVCNAACPDLVCRRGTDCSLCLTPACTECGNYNTCTSCLANAELNFLSVCECSAGYYWDTGSEACSQCDVLCSRCTGPALTDCYCGDNSYLEKYQCVCNEGFMMINSICTACDYRCLNCFGLTYYNCLDCSSYLLEKVCLPKCPVGYTTLENNCTLKNSDSIVMRFIFDSPLTILTDEIQGITAISGTHNNVNSCLDSSDPIPAYQRGIYFTGSGSYLTLPHSDDDLVLLGIRTFIAIWINPVFQNSTILFYSNQADEPLLLLGLSNLYVIAKVQVDIYFYSYLSIIPLQSDEWNHIMFSLDYNQYTSLQVMINTQAAQSLYIAEGPFIDNLNNVMIVGADELFLNFFNGFIYSIEFYLELPLLSTLAILDKCNGCFVCPATGLCIPNCNITSFYNSATFQCMECKIGCSSSCRNQVNCTLCLDTNCVLCNSFSANSCTECASGYYLQNNTCTICSYSSYYDSLHKTCKDCMSLCIDCSSANSCNTCKENSYLLANNTCECDLGYFLNNSICERLNFYALISIDSNNIVRLTFTEDLTSLDPSGVTVQINDIPQTFTLQKHDNSTYLISVGFTADINPGEKITIKFTAPVVSIFYSLLATQVLNIELFPTPVNDEIAAITQANNLAQAAIIAGITAVFGSSVINVNPITFFNFLNNISIYVYLSLYYQNLDAALVSFITMINPGFWMPNLFLYFINPRDGNQLSSTFRNFGYSTNLLIINSGPILCILAGMLVVPLIALCFRHLKIGWLNKQCTKLLNSYKFSAFLRFFLQFFIDLICNSAIGMYYTNLENFVQIIDFLLCIVIFVLVI